MLMSSLQVPYSRFSMVAVPWATTRQEEFLKERLPRYREIFESNKNYTDFWAELRHEWQKDENWSDAHCLFPNVPRDALDAVQREAVQSAIKATDEVCTNMFLRSGHTT